ncbi:MAG: hypothetical protein U0573_08710 [Phycisphaerales bacterium]|nr:hypothetical protein [Planctomycetota bacterium]
MAGSSVTKSVVCANCGRPIKKTGIESRNAGLFCDECAAGMRGQKAAHTERKCPICAAAIADEQEVCAGCGFDYRLGYSPRAIEVSTATGSARICPKCGHDCAAVRDAVRCPECGQGLAFSVAKVKREEDKALEYDIRVLFRKYVLPLLLAIVGVAAYLGWMMLVGERDLILLGLTKMGIRVVTLMVVTAVSMFMWLEVELDWGQVFTRLIAVAAGGYLAEQICWDCSNLLIAYPFVTIAVMALLMKGLDLEMSDAFIVTMLNWVLVFGSLMLFPGSMRFT